MNDDIYGNNLGTVLVQLRAKQINSEIKGEGTARFIFAKLSNKSIEISWAGDGGVFLEYWKGPEESGSMHEETVSSFEIAINKAIEWFNEKP